MKTNRLTARSIHVCVIACSAILLIPLSGCGGKTSIKVNPLAIPLQVFVVVGPNDFLGDPGNIGCRLSANAIRGIVTDAENDESAFGSNVDITFDGIVRKITWNQLTPGNRSISIFTFLSFVGDSGTPTSWKPNPNVLSIYFTGDLTSGGGSLFGATLDPRDANNTNLAPGIIVINDGGGANGSADPNGMKNRKTLLHEQTHYLGRFEGRSFTKGKNRFYDTGEHVFFTSSGNPATGHILVAGPNVVNGIRKTHIGGTSFPNAADECGEISTRVQNGKWNQK